MSPLPAPTARQAGERPQWLRVLSSWVGVLWALKCPLSPRTGADEGGGHKPLTFSRLALVLLLLLLLMPLSLCLTKSIQASRGSMLCACAMVGSWNTDTHR